MRWINVSFSWAILLLVLTACTQTEPSVVNPMPMRAAVQPEEVVLHNDNDIRHVAGLWKRGGKSPVELVSTYRDGNEGLANYNASTARDRLQQMGVEDITVTTLPAASSQVIAYLRVLDVGADSSCEYLPTSGPSINGYDFGGYRLGCTNDELLARQVAQAEDMEGRAPGDSYDRTSDGARAGAVVDVYRSGKPNEPLKGLSASDLAEREN